MFAFHKFRRSSQQAMQDAYDQLLRDFERSRNSNVIKKRIVDGDP
jgi:hypothetical protein